MAKGQRRKKPVNPVIEPVKHGYDGRPPDLQYVRGTSPAEAAAGLAPMVNSRESFLAEWVKAGRVLPEHETAGDAYRAKWEVASASSRSSLERIDSGRHGSSYGLPQVRIDALRWLASVNVRMGESDRFIVLKVCGEGWDPCEAVKAVDLRYKFSVTPRFKEALESLSRAITNARRENFSLVLTALQRVA